MREVDDNTGPASCELCPGVPTRTRHHQVSRPQPAPPTAACNVLLSGGCAYRYPPPSLCRAYCTSRHVTAAPPAMIISVKGRLRGIQKDCCCCCRIRAQGREVSFTLLQWCCDVSECHDSLMSPVSLVTSVRSICRRRGGGRHVV